jgi:hypothetical protein
MAPGPKFSTRMSASPTSRSNTSLPPGDFMFSVRLRLLLFSMVK